MKSTEYEGYLGPRLPKHIQKDRVRRVMEQELTALQRYTLTAYYLQGQTIPQIAKERQVNKSTICRTLHRAEDRLRRFLRY